MPLDVLSKIQNFANGGEVRNINNMVNSNPGLQSAFQGIANATTNGGANINSESIAKTESLMNALVKASKEADLSMMGLGSSIKSVDPKPLEAVETAMRSIAENGRNIPVGISIDKAQASLNDIARRIEKLRADMHFGISVSMPTTTVRQPVKPQKFATGGRVTYHRQNTETAQTGGIFRRGSSVGDRNLIFANKGEGIITEKAIRQGAKQRGMSPDMYVQALNNPSVNLPQIKKGRSFALGGRLTGDEKTRMDAFLASYRGYAPVSEEAKLISVELDELIQKIQDYDASDEENKKLYKAFDAYLKKGGTINSDEGIKTVTEMLKRLMSTKDENENVKKLDKVKSDISDVIDGAFGEVKMTIDPKSIIDASAKLKEDANKNGKGQDALSYGKIKNIAKLAYSNESIGSVFEAMLAKRSGETSIGSTKELVEAMENGGLNSQQLNVIKEICDGIEKMQLMIHKSEDRITDFKDAWRKLTKSSEYEIKHELSSIPLIGKAFNGNLVSTMAYVGAITYLSKAFVDATGNLSKFFVEQANLNKKFSEFKGAASGLFEGVDVKKFKDDMNLTREQASALTETFRKAGLSGTTAFSDIEDIAYNIRKQFGALDTSLLQEAVSLINDLPKKQIDVLINGKGTMDDEANMIANLMQSGKLDLAAELVTKGAFGEIEGLTPNMSEADRRALEVQAQIAETTDEIRGFLNNTFSPLIGTLSQRTAAIFAGIAPLARMVASTIVVERNVKEMMRKGSPKGWKIDNSSSNGGGAGKGFNVKDTAGAIATTAILAFSSWLGNKWEKEGREARERRYREKSDSIKENKQMYGVGISTSTKNYDDERWKNGAGTGLKYGSMFGAALGAFAGSVVPVLGTAVGSALGAAGGGIVGSAIGGAISLMESDEEKEYKRKDIDNTFRNKDTIQLLQDIKDRQAKETKYLEKRASWTHKDMLKGIVELSRISKVTKRIADGATTARHQMNIKAYQSNMNMMGQIGGNKNDFMLNATSAIREVQTSFVKDYQSMNQQIDGILRSSKLTNAQKEQKIADIQANELPKVFERFIQGLNNSIAQFDKVPEIVVGGIKAKMQAFTLERANNNMFGGNSSAFIQASIGMDSSLMAMSTSLEVAANDLKNISDVMSVLDKEVRRTNQALTDAEEEFIALGGEGVQVSNGNSQIRKENAEAYDRVIADYENELLSIMKNKGEENMAAYADNLAESVNSVSEIMDKASNAVANKEDWSADKAKREASGLETHLDNAKTLLEMLRSESGLSDYEKRGFADAIKSLNEVSEKISSADSAKAVENLVSTMQSVLADARGRVLNRSDERLREDEDYKRLLYGKGRIKEAAVRARTAQTAATGATDASVQKEKAYEEVLTKLTTQLDSASSAAEKMSKAMLYTADVVFTQYMTDRMKKSAKYDSLKNGGVENATMIAQYEASAIATIGKNIPKAQQKVEESRSEWQKTWGSLKDQIAGKDETAYQYFSLMEKSNEAQMKAMENPENAELAEAARAASKQVEDFYDKNQMVISQFAQENEQEYNTLMSSANNMASSIKAVSDATGEYKRQFIEFIEGLKSRVEESVQNDYGIQRKTANVNLADAISEMATSASSFQSMQKAGRVLVDTAKDLAKEQITLTKKSWDKQLAVLREQFANGEISREEFDKKYAIAVKQSEEDITRKRLEEAKKVMDSIQKYIDGMREKAGRIEESLGMEKDLYETIGAPFEYILDIEQDLVRNAKTKYDIEEEALARATKAREQGLITEAEYEKQKLKTQKASMDVIKASFGAQRDALDKLLGKMMGGFEQIGGIFGPDSDFMKARKAGQGYTQLPSGMISASGGAVTNYADRVQGLRIASGTAVGTRAKLYRGEAEIFDNGKAIPFGKEPDRYDEKNGENTSRDRLKEQPNRNEQGRSAGKSIFGGNKYAGMSGIEAVGRELQNSAFGGVEEAVEQASNTDELLAEILKDTDEIAKLFGMSTNGSEQASKIMNDASSNFSSSVKEIEQASEEYRKASAQSQRRMASAEAKSTREAVAPATGGVRRQKDIFTPSGLISIPKGVGGQTKHTLIGDTIDYMGKKRASEEGLKKIFAKPAEPKPVQSKWKPKNAVQEMEIQKIFNKGTLTKAEAERLYDARRDYRRGKIRGSEYDAILKKAYIEGAKINAEAGTIQKLHTDMSDEDAKRMAKERLDNGDIAKDKEIGRMMKGGTLSYKQAEKLYRAKQSVKKGEMTQSAYYKMHAKMLDEGVAVNKKMKEVRRGRSYLSDDEARELAMKELYPERYETKPVKKELAEEPVKEEPVYEEPMKDEPVVEAEEVKEPEVQEAQPNPEQEEVDRKKAEMRKKAEAERKRLSGIKGIIRQHGYKDLNNAMMNEDVRKYMWDTLPEDKKNGIMAMRRNVNPADKRGMVNVKWQAMKVLEEHASNIGLFQPEQQTAFSVKRGQNALQSVKQPAETAQAVKQSMQMAVATQQNAVQTASANRQAVSTGNRSMDNAMREASVLQAKAEKDKPIAERGRAGEGNDSLTRLKIEVTVTSDDKMFDAKVRKVVDHEVPNALSKQGRGLNTNGVRA